MSADLGTRREARERALGLLYEVEAKGTSPDDVLAEQQVPPDEFAIDVVHGVGEHKAQIDELIRRYAKGWTLERMPVIDRTLVRRLRSLRERHARPHRRGSPPRLTDLGLFEAPMGLQVLREPHRSWPSRG